jgi:hypothetical protein
MADSDWRRDRDNYRDRSEFLDDRDYDRRTYVDRYEPPYDDQPYDTRDYDDYRHNITGEHHSHGPSVADRVRNWWHRNVSDPDSDTHTYDRDYSHGPISAGHSGWTRDREWENRTLAEDARYTDRDWRTDNYSRVAGVSTYGTTGMYSGGLYGGRYVGRGPKSWRRSDERIREDVNEELTRHPDVDASEVEVAVVNSEVTLTGTVDGRHEKREAEECAWRVTGVRDVHNQLRIKQGVGSVIASVFDRDRR